LIGALVDRRVFQSINCEWQRQAWKHRNGGSTPVFARALDIPIDPPTNQSTD
jgi:hypothetical protein